VRRALSRGAPSCQGTLDYLRVARPDYLAIFPGWLPCVGPPDFPELLRLEVPDNITLGDDVIALHATPWTRHALRRPPPAPPAAPAGEPSPSRPD
jgi:hypothetical protein